jgi:hypothetical protein
MARRLSDAEVTKYNLVLVEPALRIDDAFIATWGPRYDEKDKDEGEYQRLLRRVREERATSGRISVETFAAILFWKWKDLNWARNSRHVKWDSYDTVYASELAREIWPSNVSDFALDEGIGDRTRELAGLPGLGVPTASTVLHFLAPDKVPIIDRRTAEVLFKADVSKNEKTDEIGYLFFRSTIRGVLARCDRPWTLRQLDRALFAYHKLALSR